MMLYDARRRYNRPPTKTRTVVQENSKAPGGLPNAFLEGQVRKDLPRNFPISRHNPAMAKHRKKSGAKARAACAF